jgi:hypothetical protein
MLSDPDFVKTLLRELENPHVAVCGNLESGARGSLEWVSTPPPREGERPLDDVPDSNVSADVVMEALHAGATQAGRVPVEARVQHRSSESRPALPYLPYLPYLTLPYPTCPGKVSPNPALPYLPYLTLPYPTRPGNVSPNPALPYLPYLTLPYPTSRPGTSPCQPRPEVG